MKYFLIAGEASGDLHASNLIKSLARRDAQAEFRFMGGDLMTEAAGCEPVVHYRKVAYMGFLPVLRHLGEIADAAKKVKSAIREFNPDVVIPVDFGTFNFKYILPYVHDMLGIPVVYYISPKVWAWKRWRVKIMEKYVDTLLCILPFETVFFKPYDIKTVFVGNPCVDAVNNYRVTAQPKLNLNIETGEPVVAILCGSRRQEVAANLPYMLEAVASVGGVRPVIAGAPGLTMEDYVPYLKDRKVEIVFGATYELVEKSRAVLVTSGTATLETCLLGTPQVVCYRAGGSRVIRWGFRYLFPIKYFSLVNLVADFDVVPELLAHEVTVDNIATHLKAVLSEGAERTRQIKGYRDVYEKLGNIPCSERAAEAVLTALKS